MSFTVETPSSVREALELLAGGDKAVLAGGTDLMVWVAEGSWAPEKVVSIAELEVLKTISIGGDAVELGALATFADLLACPLPEELACLREAAAQTGGPQIRNMGTVGGNICTASPAGDLCAALVCLEAAVRLESVSGVRELPLREFFTGPKKTVRRPDELLTKIRIPLRGRGRSCFAKLGKRNSLIIATANVAVYAHIDGTVREIAIAAGSAAPTVAWAENARRALLGKPLTAETIEAACGALQDDIRPITDLRATASYRRKVCANLLRDCLEKLMREDG